MGLHYTDSLKKVGIGKRINKVRCSLLISSDGQIWGIVECILERLPRLPRPVTLVSDNECHFSVHSRADKKFALGQLSSPFVGFEISTENTKDPQTIPQIVSTPPRH